MKRLLSVILIMTLLIMPVLAEDTWVCPGCGKTVSAEFPFCPWCRHQSVLPQPTAEPEDWFCAKCGRWNDADYPFCPFCTGSREDVGLKEGEWFCVNCQRVNKGGFCGKCGRPHIEAAVTPQPKVTPEPMPTPVPEHISELQAMTDAEVGDYVTFGRYPQTAEGNDQTPIEWIVLDKKEDKVMLLSRYGLDAKQFNDKSYISWEKCTLRWWLNGEFMNRAFSAGEQNAILITKLGKGKIEGYREWWTENVNETQDKVFLLSYEEANRYLGVTYNDSTNVKSRVAPTELAKKRGAFTSDSYMTMDGEAAGWWWLRSPGKNSRSAAHVHSDGSLYRNNVDDYRAVVRPAMWVDLDSVLF